MHTRSMSQAKTLPEVIACMREIDANLPVDDGVRVFNRMYLTITDRIAAIIADPNGGHGVTFRNGPAMTDLDVRFANLWLAAYEADETGRPSRRVAADLRGTPRRALSDSVRSCRDEYSHRVRPAHRRRRHLSCS